ncbi:MAG: type II toxin-antitoxin system HipA family toxin [Prevotellaceae bacterium]|jgi:serine/threonine-protein kinase HipA|nr:type II toxin-antitoxin system HipA family toxin [Prevotellaceae bacterium]
MKEIFVYADWIESSTPQLIGKLLATPIRGKEVFSFEYDPEWLKSSDACNLDPDLGLYHGTQYTHSNKSNFGVFTDSAPDRWGRVLMDRRESLLSRIEKRPRHNLMESDYLLGVFDEHRMGALRYKTSPDEEFLNDDQHFSTPPWTSLRELEQASYKLEEDVIEDDPKIMEWLYLLLAPGSSLGGARPKAGVANTDGTLWIAKFPSKDDRTDIGVWEMLVNELGKQAGLQMAQAMVKKFSGKHHTFLTKRFDRRASGTRIHFSSAMTLLGYTDGDDANCGVSYLELAEFIMRSGARVSADLEELFRRIVFSICVSNTDDHLRNHGFLLTPEGWILSPAYDINPNPHGIGLRLNISDKDNSLDLGLAREIAPYLRLSDNKATSIIKHIGNIVSDWRRVATQYKIPRNEQEQMKPAFRW